MSKFADFEGRFAGLEGFFTPRSMAIWEFLLNLQNAWGISGNYFEIGVWKGKSALFGAMYLSEKEICCLLDIQPDTHLVAEFIQRETGVKTQVSENLRSDHPKSLIPFQELQGTARWFHIDGDHSGYATYNDLLVAERFLGDRGIICVDDFYNLRYPRLPMAVFRFLQDRSSIYTMLLCTVEKCYIVRKCDYVFYEKQIRESLSSHFKKIGLSYTLSKSSYAFDGGCFSVLDRVGEFDLLGRDEDPQDVPF